MQSFLGIVGAPQSRVCRGKRTLPRFIRGRVHRSRMIDFLAQNAVITAICFSSTCLPGFPRFSLSLGGLTVRLLDCRRARYRSTWEESSQTPFRPVDPTGADQWVRLWANYL